MRFIAAAAALVLGFAPTALAQPVDWVVVPTSTTDDIAWMQPSVGALSAALSEQGISVLPSEQAVILFEQKGSAPSTEVSDTDIEEWVAKSREAIRHLARGDYATALKELKEAQLLSRKAADELNREQTRAQNVLDTCLYMVRALLETGNRSRAKAQVQECVRLVPQGEPSPHMHPPNVVSRYKEASEPGPEQTGSLTVNSDPSGCAVRINGVRFGETPFEMADLYPGEYQVQVECDPDRRGRVHRVYIRAGRAEAFVNADFDQAVRTEPLLRLRYPDKSKAQRQVIDAQEVAKVLGSGAVVLASIQSIDTMELRVVSGTERRGGIARIPTTPSGPTARVASAAAVALANGECKDFTGPKPVTIDCKTARAGAPAEAPKTASGWPADRPPRGQWISGLSLVSAGGASLLASYGVLIWRRGAGNDWVNEFDPNDTANQVKWTNLGSGIAVTALAGGALTVTAMPLLLPYRSKTPWWAWLSGGLGVGAAVVAIVSGVTADGAPDGSSNCQLVTSVGVAQTCVDRKRSTDRAIVLGVTAAPLLTIPLVYLFRKDEKKHGASFTPGVVVNRNGGSLSVRGEF